MAKVKVWKPDKPVVLTEEQIAKAHEESRAFSAAMEKRMAKLKYRGPEGEIQSLGTELRKAKRVLKEFVELFEGDRPDLADLNDVYEGACELLGREAKVIE